MKMKHIKTNKDFEKSLDYLLESYNTPVDIKWIDNNNQLIGLFMINDKIYQITCADKGEDIWTYKFYLYENNELSPNLTNYKRGSLSVLSTVRDGMKYLLNNKQPKGLVFGALDKSEGRKKLYLTYSNEISNLYNYEFITKNQDNKQLYILFKNDIDREILFKKIQEIIEELFNEI